MRNNRLIITIIFVFSSSVIFSQWNLVWSDEFDYSGMPNSTKWSFDTEGNNWDWGNDEAQNYTPASNNNAWVEDGNLLIEARKEAYRWDGDGETKQYTSARLITQGKGDWLYGKVEVRALLPTGRGMWPAIWMLPTNSDYGGWPKSGELDIMENVGYDPNVIHCNIHTEAYNHSIGTNKGNSTTVTNPHTNWHIYSLEWNAENVSFFCDDKLVFSFNNEHKTYKEWPFDKPFHLLLNIAVGGGWGGTEGIDDNIFPQRMLVDYVRVYEKSDIVAQEPFGGSPHSIPGTIQFEDFDNGGQDVSYYDNSAENENSATYRSRESVDIEDCSDTGGGYNIANTESEEWMEYTVNVQQTGTYTIGLRVASEGAGKTISLSSNDNVIAENITIPNTGGWQIWETVKIDNINLQAGEQVLRITIGNTDYVNLNYMTFETYAGKPTISITDPADNSQFNTNQEITINATANSETATITSVSFYVNNNLTLTDNNAPYSADLQKMQEGSYTIKAETTDSNGNSSYDEINITITEAPTPMSVNLKKGWNLIGFPYSPNQDITKALSGIINYVQVVKDLDGFYDTSIDPNLNSLSQFKRGKGYFIYVTQDCELIWTK